MLRYWLWTQAVVFFPLLVFCLMLAALFFTLPDDAETGPLLETAASGVEIIRNHADDGRLTLRAGRLRGLAGGGAKIDDLHLHINTGAAVLDLQNSVAELNKESTRLRLPRATGELVAAADGRRASLVLEEVVYHLADGKMEGGAVLVREANNRFSGDRFTFSPDGRLIVTDNIRASFPLGNPNGAAENSEK